MFYEDPNVSVSRRNAEFLYGNGVSVRDAAKLCKTSQRHMYGWFSGLFTT